jgi:hypothetical protein
MSEHGTQEALAILGKIKAGDVDAGGTPPLTDLARATATQAGLVREPSLARQGLEAGVRTLSGLIVGNPEMPLPGGMHMPAVTRGTERVLTSVGEAAIPLAATALVPGGALAQAAASGGGEAVNQLVGISEPSATNLATQTAVPLVMGPLVRTGVQRLARRSSIAAHEVGVDRVRALDGLVRGPGPSADDLYSIVSNQPGPIQIPMVNMRQTIRGLFSQEALVAAGLKLDDFQRTAEDLRRMTRTRVTAAGVVNPQGAMEFQAVRSNLKRVGEKIRETTGEEQGAWKATWHAMMQDLEAAASAGNPTQQAVQALKAANAQARREFAAREFAEILEQGGGLTSRADLGVMATGEPMLQVNANKIIGALRKSEDFRKSLPAADYDAVVADLADLAQKLPALPAYRGVNVGSKLALERLARVGSAGTLIGGGLGMSPGTAAAAGTLLATTVPALMGKLAMSEPGRAFLKLMLTQSGGAITQRTASLMSAYLASTQPVRRGGETAVSLGAAHLRNIGVLPQP